MLLVQFIYTVLAVINFVDAAKILAVFPIASFSHQVVFRVLTHELVRRGHEVVVVTTDPVYPNDEKLKNLTEIDVHDLSYQIKRDFVVPKGTFNARSDDLPNQMRVFMPLLSYIFEKQMQSNEMQYLIKNNSSDFDLLLIESYVRPAMALSHVFKAPVILVSSSAGFLNNYDVMGAPKRPVLLYPTLMRQRIYNLTFFEKLKDLYHHYLLEHIFASIEDEDNERVKRLFGPDTPLLRELDINAQLLLLNVHTIWEQNRPVPPNVVFVGGLHVTPPKALPLDLQSYLDASKNGVIYISFGTSVDPTSLPPEIIKTMVRVFSNLPYDVLWKWNEDTLSEKGDNIKIAKWFPQPDLLRHSKVKLFVTQGGQQSTDEAIEAGVPLIGMPVISDQWFNVEQYLFHKIGLRLDMETLTDEKLSTAVLTVLKNDTYRKNVLKLRTLMRDEPRPPLERAVWWVEYVIRHQGAAHLKARAANLSWSEYLDIEFFSIVAIILLTIISAVVLTLLSLINFILRFKRTNVKLKIK